MTPEKTTMSGRINVEIPSSKYIGSGRVSDFTVSNANHTETLTRRVRMLTSVPCNAQLLSGP